MRALQWLMLALLLLVTLAALGGILWQRRKYRRTMQRLLEMLEAAIGGTFQEQSYDESLLSAVGNKLDAYLSASLTSARNLETEKEKIKELIADISHQTKTPIANILLYAQLLDEQELPPQSRNCLAALQNQTEKLSFLVASLVKLSRLETGILALHPQKHALQPMMEQLQAQFSPQATERGIQLLFQLTEEQALFDPKWTAEALANLLDNALKYTPNGGTVRVSALAYELFCRIDVQDDGPGIAEAEQARVFTRFYRSPTVSQQEGLGIGLYLARQIVSEQGGYLKLQSAPGQGSTFSLFLPRQ